jgi:hypothetical protein
VAGRQVISLPTLPAMQQPLRVDTVGVHAMAIRWGVSAGELDDTVTPARLGLSCQASAAAVNAAHADVAAFTSGLAARVGTHASHVSEADTRYLANEADADTSMAAVARRVSGV